MTNETDDLLNDLLGTTVSSTPPGLPTAPEPTPAAPKKTRAKAKAKPPAPGAAPEPTAPPEPDVIKIAEPKVPVFVATVEDAPDWTPKSVVAEPSRALPGKPLIDHSKRTEGDYSHLSAEQRSRLEAEQRAGRGY